MQGVGELWLAPGDSLTVVEQKAGASKTFVYTGTGAVENNLLQETRGLVHNYPFLGAEGLIRVTDQLSIDSFLLRLTAYEKASKLVLSRSRIAGFTALAPQLIHAYCQQLLIDYRSTYGVDWDAQDQMMTLSAKMAQDSTSKVNIDSAMKAARPKSLSVCAGGYRSILER